MTEMIIVIILAVGIIGSGIIAGLIENNPDIVQK